MRLSGTFLARTVLGVAILSAATLMMTGNAVAQPPQPYFPPGYGGWGGGYGGWNYGGYASTPAEGYARGMADIVRAQGQYNLLTSAAMINVEQARKQYIENRMDWTNTYFEMRRMNKEYRDAERGPRPTQEDWIRYARDGAPDELSPSQLDPLTGKVAWPRVLLADKYAELRNQIDSNLAARATTGQLATEEYLKTLDDINALSAALEMDIRDYPPKDYLYAKKFLGSLSFALQKPAAS